MATVEQLVGALTVEIVGWRSGPVQFGIWQLIISVVWILEPTGSIVN